MPLWPHSFLLRQEGVIYIPLHRLPGGARVLCAVLVVQVLRRLWLILLQLQRAQTHSTSVTRLLRADTL